MKWFYNMKIGMKLLVGFGIVALLTLVVGIIGVSQITKADRDYSALYDNFGSPLGQIGEVGIYFNRIRFNLLSLTQSNRGNVENIVTKIEKYDQKISDGLNRYGKTLRTVEGKREFGRLMEDYKEFQSVQQRIINFALTGQRGQALLLLNGEAQTLSEEMNKIIDGQFGLKVQAGQAKSKAIKSEVNGTIWMMVIIVLVGTVFAFVIGLFIAGAINRPIKKLVEAVDSLLHGNVNIHIEAASQDEIGILMNAFGRMVETIKGMINETDMLARAAMEGRLDARGKSEAFEGSWGELIQGFNQILDAVIGPLNVAAEYVDRISKGDIPPKITDTYYGDFNEIKNNFNQCIDVINALIQNTNQLAMEASEGNLAIRGDAGKFAGGYAQIVAGFNATLDAVINPLNEAEQVLASIAMNDYSTEMTGNYNGKLKELKESINETRGRLLSVQDALVRASKGDTSRLDEFKKIGRRSENDQMMPAMTALYQSIQDIIEEVDRLSQAGINGNLKLRGDVQHFEGGFREIVEGFNQTLDAIVAPITEASAVLHEMANGNLQVNVVGDYKGDHAALKDSVNLAIDAFNEVLREFNGASEQVASGAREVSDSSQALSQGSAEQASTVEEITASMEEIAAQTKQNAVNAGQANELSNTAKENAIQGNERMKEMLRAMDGINDSSANISKIIKVIDEIAFQTNILALNAAVEAARAGQHGKGFAVVAEEVRNLAARSANAAKETTALIEGSIKKVEAGTQIANETAKALDHIVTEVSKATGLVGEIAVASNEQATAITQINQGVSQVSQVTQNNSAMAEQSASASEELASQAQLLKEMVQRFKIKAGIGNTNAIAASINTKRQVNENIHKGRAEAAATISKGKKVSISLDDGEFGKY